MRLGRFLPLAIIALAFALRAGWVLHRSGAGEGSCAAPRFEYPDEALHWQLASNLVHEGLLISADGRFAVRMPFYPLFLVPFACASDAGILLAKLAQALLGAATVWIVWGWARAAVGTRGALLAAGLAAVDPFAIFFTNLLLSEVLFTTLLVGLVASAWCVVASAALEAPALANHNRRRTNADPDSANDADTQHARLARASRRLFYGLLGMAFCGAAAVLTRPSSAALVPLVWIVVGWFLARGPRPRLAASVLICPVILALGLAPWGLRNQGTVGAPAWLSTNGGVTLYDAQGPQADGSSNQQFLHELPELTDLGEVARDEKLRQLAWEQMRRDPARVLRLTVVKFGRTWNPFPNVAEYSRGGAAWIGAVYSLVLYLGALAGLVAGSRLCQPRRAFAEFGRAEAVSRRAFLVLTALPIVYFAFVHVIYIGSLRYRVPLMPLLAVLTAGSLGHYLAKRPSESDI